jgi:hypothetical protein
VVNSSYTSDWIIEPYNRIFTEDLSGLAYSVLILAEINFLSHTYKYVMCIILFTLIFFYHYRRSATIIFEQKMRLNFNQFVLYERVMEKNGAQLYSIDHNPKLK